MENLCFKLETVIYKKLQKVSIDAPSKDFPHKALLAVVTSVVLHACLICNTVSQASGQGYVHADTISF